MSRAEIVEIVGDEPMTARAIAEQVGSTPERVRSAMRKHHVAHTRQRPRRFYRAS